MKRQFPIIFSLSGQSVLFGRCGDYSLQQQFLFAIFNRCVIKSTDLHRLLDARAPTAVER
jgi:hypothetical protein